MSNFVIKLKIKTPCLWQFNYINKKLKITKYIYNALRNIELKKLNELENDKEYIRITSISYSKRTEEDKAIYSSLIKKYGFTRFDFINDVKPIYKFYKKSYSSQMTQAVAKRLYTSFYKYFFSDGDEIHEMIRCNSFEGTSNLNGIIFDKNTMTVKIDKYTFDLEYNKKNSYITDSLENEVSYVRISKMTGKTKDHLYAEIVLKGRAPKKKRVKGVGSVGIDIGTSTIAISSKDMVYIDELAKEINPMTKELKRIERKLERSRRQTNPENYNPDGTIINRKYHWYKSNHYLKLNRKKRYLSAKIARKRNQSHEILANRILSLGNEIILENMSFKGLQKRALKTEKNEQGQYKKKKRFGKSLNRHAPSTLIETLKRKGALLDVDIKEIDTKEIKASQYNHITKEYKKKELKERKTQVGNSIIQRDLYSAFLLMNVKNDKIDQQLCEETFEKFKELHEIEIKRLQKQKNISCIGY